ncbi:MAG: enoyl-CoA hydratase-related protein [Acidimicrobiales bacterium]
MTEPTLYELSGSIATITLNCPERANALSPRLVNSLGDRLAASAVDPACRVVVLTNNGPSFCAGADLRGGFDEEPRWSLAQLLTAVLEHPKPVIGRVVGHCMGGGVGLAAACDVSVAANDIQLGFTEVRVGVAPAIISVVCLAKMRTGDALELFLSGERFGAARAVEVGLVNRAVERALVDEEVAKLVKAMLLASPDALTAAKRLVRDVPGLGRPEAFEWTTRLSAELFASPEAGEGMAAFRERRLPSWAARREPEDSGDLDS